MLKHLLFIYNPTSGTGKIANELSTVLDTFTKAGWLTTVYPTQGKGDAARAARELGPQFERVVCAGGDGTLSEVSGGLLGLEAPPPLGYIPFGSTNDCATTLRLPRDPVKAAQTASSHQPLPPEGFHRAEFPDETLLPQRPEKAVNLPKTEQQIEKGADSL